MPHQMVKFILGSDLMSFREEINRQNRMAIHYLAVAGIPLSLASIAAQTIIKGAPTLTQNGAWMLIYFVALALANFYVFPESWSHATLMVYLLQCPVMVVAILLGTLWDPNHQALTFLMFMVVMPVFVLDYPWRVLLVVTGWNVVFLALCLAVKDPSTRQGDLLHTLEFYLSSIAVTMVVLMLRFDVLRGHERVRYHMEHDALTGTRNRQCLEANIDRFRDRPLILLMGDLDQLDRINDFYGREVGDNLLVSFAAILLEVFGEEHVYRYGGDGFLCVVPASQGEFRARVETARKKLADLYDAGQTTSTCSFGYVTGCPRHTEEFRSMVQLAEIQVHKAGRLDQGSIVGCAYDEAALRAGIVEANLSSHMKAYETNHLTGLPGLDYFLTRCDELLLSYVYMEHRPVIGFLNLVRLQSFNDAFGYLQGDELIRVLVKELQRAFPQRHLAYLGNGRFAVMCYLAEAEPAVQRVNLALREYRSDIPVEIKAGFAEYQQGESLISLLDKAKLSHDSIYSHKNRYYRLFDDTINEERQFRQYILTHIDEALEKGWTKVYYQPIVRSLSQEICNMEALSRWEDPQFGFLMPGRFISVLEEEGVIYKLNLQVVRQVVRDFGRMEQEGLPLVPVSVNLSRRDFSERDMVKEISAILDEAGYPHSLLKVEITESAFMENPELLRRELERFHENGFAVWMDDFGSEFSTLNLLNKLSFDLVKIDMQFMRDFTDTGKNSIIVDDVIDMCKRLGITTLVEGVETRDHFEALLRLGGEKLQGYYFARPMPLSAIINAIQRGELCPPEREDQRDYYARLGHINLHSPLSGINDQGLTLFQSIPAALVELRGESCRLIRDNEAMHHWNHRLFPDRQALQPLSALPECCSAALGQVRESDQWVYTHGQMTGEQTVSIYAQRLAANSDGAVAALLVVLPG